jgi:hypothetical protein
VLEGKGLPGRRENDIVEEETEIVGKVVGFSFPGHNNEGGALQLADKARDRKGASRMGNRPNAALIREEDRAPTVEKWGERCRHGACRC